MRRKRLDPVQSSRFGMVKTGSKRFGFGLVVDVDTVDGKCRT